jgi:putative membrane protein
MTHHDWDENGGWWALPMVLMMFVLLAGVAIAVYLVIRSQRQDRQPHLSGLSAPAVSASTAEQILAERFARGEIDAEEYRVRLAALRGSGT